MRRIAAAVLFAAAVAVTMFGSTGASALECIRVQDVFRYCPGRVCITEPCYIIDR